MIKNEVIEITQDEALTSIPDDREKIHCMIESSFGFLGADWSKDRVVDLIKNSKRIAWADNMFEHNLAIINDGKLYTFDIKK